MFVQSKQKKDDFPSSSSRSLTRMFKKHDFWENAFNNKTLEKTWQYNSSKSPILVLSERVTGRPPTTEARGRIAIGHDMRSITR